MGWKPMTRSLARTDMWLSTFHCGLSCLARGMGFQPMHKVTATFHGDIYIDCELDRPLFRALDFRSFRTLARKRETKLGRSGSRTKTDPERRTGVPPVCAERWAAQPANSEPQSDFVKPASLFKTKRLPVLPSIASDTALFRNPGKRCGCGNRRRVGDRPRRGHSP